MVPPIALPALDVYEWRNFEMDHLREATEKEGASLRGREERKYVFMVVCVN